MLGRQGAGERRAPGFLSVGAVISGAALGFAITFAGAALLGLAASLTAWQGIDADIAWFSYLSIALGGMLAAKRSRRTGWLHGGLVGLVYFAVSAAFFQSGFTWGDLLAQDALAKALYSFAAGALGGVLGINL